MIILHFHLQPQFKNELFHVLHISNNNDNDNNNNDNTTQSKPMHENNHMTAF